MYNDYKKLYQYFIEVKNSIEINIDFSDDIGNEEGLVLFKEKLGKFKSHIGDLYNRSNILTSDFFNSNIVLVGEPNFGKKHFF